MRNSLTDQALQQIFDRCFGLDEIYTRTQRLIDEVSGQETTGTPGLPYAAPADCPENTKGEL